MHFCFLFISRQGKLAGDLRWMVAITWKQWHDGHVLSNSSLSEVDHGICDAQLHCQIDSLRWDPRSVSPSAPLWLQSCAGKEWALEMYKAAKRKAGSQRPGSPSACPYPLTNGSSLQMAVTVTDSFLLLSFWMYAVIKDPKWRQSAVSEESCHFLSIWTRCDIVWYTDTVWMVSIHSHDIVHFQLPLVPHPVFRCLVLSQLARG